MRGQEWLRKRGYLSWDDFFHGVVLVGLFGGGFVLLLVILGLSVRDAIVR